MADSSTTQPNLGLTAGWAANDSPWGDKMNANLRQLDALVMGAVKDKDLTAPPGGPADGDRYIVGGSATGDWAAHDDEIAQYETDEWVFYTPKEGWIAWVADEDLFYVFDGSAWAELEAGTGGTSHNILSATHTDSTAGTVVRGDLIVGKTGPTWDRLALGVSGKVLKSDGNDVVWGDEAGGGATTAYVFLNPRDFYHGSGQAVTSRGSGTSEAPVLNLSGSADQVLLGYFTVPAGYSSVASLKFIYCNTGTSANNFVIQPGMKVCADASDLTQAVTTATKSTITPSTTQDEVDIVTLNTPAETLAAGNVVRLYITRPANGDGDDANTDAMAVIGVLLTFNLA